MQIYVGNFFIFYFFTPVYSSTVFVLMVVVLFVLSHTCVYVAVVLTVRQALQEVMPSATAQQVSSAKTIVSMIL